MKSQFWNDKQIKNEREHKAFVDEHDLRRVLSTDFIVIFAKVSEFVVFHGYK